MAQRRLPHHDPDVAHTAEPGVRLHLQQPPPLGRQPLPAEDLPVLRRRLERQRERLAGRRLAVPHQPRDHLVVFKRGKRFFGYRHADSSLAHRPSHPSVGAKHPQHPQVTDNGRHPGEIRGHMRVTGCLPHAPAWAGHSSARTKHTPYPKVTNDRPPARHAGTYEWRGCLAPHLVWRTAFACDRRGEAPGRSHGRESSIGNSQGGS